MGPDALVYCDCFEKGRLLEPPPPGSTLTVATDGTLLCVSEELEVQLAFDHWRYDRACAHESGILVHHRIGNAVLVSLLRRELQLSTRGGGAGESPFRGNRHRGIHARF